MEFEVERFESQKRERLIRRRLEVAVEISRLEAVLHPLKREEQLLTQTIAELLPSTRYEEPSIRKNFEVK